MELKVQLLVHCSAALPEQLLPTLETIGVSTTEALTTATALIQASETAVHSDIMIMGPTETIDFRRDDLEIAGLSIVGAHSGKAHLSEEVTKPTKITFSKAPSWSLYFFVQTPSIVPITPPLMRLKSAEVPHDMWDNRPLALDLSTVRQDENI